MIVTINIPDTLPDERVRQRIRELEESLREEAEFLKRMKSSEDNENRKLFFKSFGSWKDERSSEEIIKEIYDARNSSEREIIL